jgi:hypothetical protein
MNPHQPQGHEFLRFGVAVICESGHNHVVAKPHTASRSLNPKAKCAITEVRQIVYEILAESDVVWTLC